MIKIAVFKIVDYFNVIISAIFFVHYSHHKFASTSPCVSWIINSNIIWYK